MPFGNGVSLLPRVFLIRGGRGDGSAALPMVQATRYTNCVSATNFAGLASADLCSSGMAYDGSAPEDGGMFDFDDSLYYNASREVCTSWSDLVEDVSLVVSAEMQLFEQRGISEVAQGDPISLTPEIRDGALPSRTRCYTPLSGPLVEGKFYFTRMTAINSAVPPVILEARTRGFFVDRTAPYGGLIELRIAFPQGFDKQPGFAQTPASVLGLEFGVRAVLDWEEEESAIGTYDVVILADGAPLHEVTLYHGDLDDEYRADGFWQTPIYNGTLIEVIVVCANQARLRSEPVTASELLILGAIKFERPYRVDDETIARLTTDASAFVEQPDALSLAFKRAYDPIGQEDTRFRYSFTLLPNCSLETVARFQGEVRDKVATSRLYHHISERYHLTSLTPHPAVQHVRTAVSREGTGGVDLIFVKTFNAQLPLGEPTCASVTACTIPTQLLPIERCVNSTTTLFLFDDTPPRVQVDQAYTFSGEGAMLPLRFPVHCDDPESRIKAVYFSLGTPSQPRRYVANLPLEIGANGSTNSTNSSGTNTSKLPHILSYLANRTGFSGIISITDGFLRRTGVEIRQGEQLVASVLCRNGMSLQNQARSTAVRFDDEPPVHGLIEYGEEPPLLIPGLRWSAETRSYTGKVNDFPLTVFWMNFSDVGSGIAYYNICVGDVAFGCTYENHTAPRNGTSTMLEMTSPPTSTDDTPAPRFHISVTAVDVRGMSTGASVPAFIDTTPPSISDLSATAANGVVTLDGVLVTNRTELTMILDEEPFDQDTDDIEVLLTAHSVDQPARGSIANCTFAPTNNGSSLAWTAYCAVEEFASFCIDAVAVNLAGLSSTRSALTCIVVDKTAPVWPPGSGALIWRNKQAPPDVSADNTTRLPGIFATWPTPYDDESGVSSLDVSVCTVVECVGVPVGGANQTSIFIEDDHPALVDYDGVEYTGVVWLKARAESRTHAELRPHSPPWRLLHS